MGAYQVNTDNIHYIEPHYQSTYGIEEAQKYINNLQVEAIEKVDLQKLSQGIVKSLIKCHIEEGSYLQYVADSVVDWKNGVLIDKRGNLGMLLEWQIEFVTKLFKVEDINKVVFFNRYDTQFVYGICNEINSDIVFATNDIYFEIIDSYNDVGYVDFKAIDCTEVKYIEIPSDAKYVARGDL